MRKTTRELVDEFIGKLNIEDWNKIYKYINTQAKTGYLFRRSRRGSVSCGIGAFVRHDSLLGHHHSFNQGFDI
jgi:hypothetical protein